METYHGTSAAAAHKKNIYIYASFIFFSLNGSFFLTDGNKQQILKSAHKKKKKITGISSRLILLLHCENLYST